MLLGFVASNGEEMPPIKIWPGLQTNLCHLLRRFGDESCFMSQEDHWEIRLRLPKGWSAGTHGKGCAGLVGHQQELSAQRYLAPTVSRLEPVPFQLLDAHWGKGMQDTPQKHRWVQGFFALSRYNRARGHLFYALQ